MDWKLTAAVVLTSLSGTSGASNENVRDDTTRIISQLIGLLTTRLGLLTHWRRSLSSGMIAQVLQDGITGIVAAHRPLTTVSMLFALQLRRVTDRSWRN